MTRLGWTSTPCGRLRVSAAATGAVDSRLLEQAELPTASLIDPTQRFVTVLPLMVELGLPGVLEVMSDKPLAMESLKPIQTLLKVFANFQNLLESSQRDSLTGLLNRQTFDATFLKASMPSQPDPGHNGERRGVRPPPAIGWGWSTSTCSSWSMTASATLIGDEVLVLVARIMRQSFRHYDRLYRFGGEEFVVLLRGGTEDDAQQAYERFRSNVETYVFPQVNKVTISLGFTEVMHNDTPSVAFRVPTKVSTRPSTRGAIRCSVAGPGARRRPQDRSRPRGRRRTVLSPAVSALAVGCAPGRLAGLDLSFAHHRIAGQGFGARLIVLHDGQRVITSDHHVAWPDRPAGPARVHAGPCRAARQARAHNGG